jgi:hypothetical protein
MRKFFTGLATLAALAAGVTMLSGRSEAAGLPGAGALNDAADAMVLTENVQLYMRGGRRYCWYDDGWQGPGWYWCGYRWRRGFGWGGGLGWGRGFGWHHHGGMGGGWMGGGGGGPMGGGWMGGGGGPMGWGGGGGPMGGGFMGGGPMGFGGGGGGGGGGFMGGGPMGFGGGGGGGGGFMGGGPMGFGGGMGGAPSDIRVKHDVALLGRLDNGVGFYRFSYKGSDKAYVGVMAHEVQKVRPDVVTRGSDGYLRVYYDRLGVQMQTYEDWVAGGEKIPAISTSIRQ